MQQNSAYTQPRTLLFLLLAERPGVCKKLGDIARTAAPDWSKGHPIPYGITASNRTKVKEEEVGGGGAEMTVGRTAFVFPINHYT